MNAGIVSRKDEWGAVRWEVAEKLHRLDGPAVEEDGVRMWYVNDKLHRLDGPAVENSNGLRAWYVNGKLHRLDGPAIEHDSCGTRKWFVDDRDITEKVQAWMVENDISPDYESWDLATKVEMCLIFR